MVTWNLVGITPGPLGSGFPELEDRGEASSQTVGLGSPVVINASGVVAAIATNGTLVRGFLAKAAQNGASDGAKTAKLYVVKPNQKFVGTLSVASWDTTLIGSKVAFAISGSTHYLATATGISSIAQCRVLGPAHTDVAAGDANPPVYFSVLNANVQGEV